MDAFCSNTLSQTQCNGLTRIEFSSIVSVGIVQGFSGLILAGYLTFICQRQASSSAWILALTGILYLITTSLEAASRFLPGSLTQFLSMEKATAGLGNVTLILYFSFHVASVIVLTKRYDPKVAPIVAAILTSLAAVALAFNILALLAISYEELPEGIRAGAPTSRTF
ncbi:hypothetical protein PSHT_00174 [Puccinia striiformis]|uniref:Uncharacterized protein n=1 Tax=Puccinia striiformis TaxID=27350 RepID=A0A2S4WP12_9BASI|nr:hypothetical protein PSHT_00174 [Puccinia striiformis]